MLQQVKEYFRKIKHDVLAQEVKGKYCNLSYRRHSYFIFCLSLINLIFGILFTYLYSRLYESTIKYSGSGSYAVYLPKGGINFYIQLEDFYQSHLRNSKSISPKQLEGKQDVESKRTSPLDYRNDIPIYPAGILSNTYFNDLFSIDGLKFDTSDINWDSARDKIKQAGYTRNEVAPPPMWGDYTEIPKLYEDERYINWIYNAPYYSFRKLWGRLDVPKSGNYILNIDSSFEFGKKSVVFTQTSWAGNKNYFLSTTMIIVGVFGLICAVVLYIKD